MISEPASPKIISMERSGIIGDYLKCQTNSGVFYSLDNGKTWMTSLEFVQSLEMARNEHREQEQGNA